MGMDVTIGVIFVSGLTKIVLVERRTPDILRVHIKSMRIICVFFINVNGGNFGGNKMAIRGTLTDLDEHKLENAFETLRDMYIDAKREGGNKIVYVTVQVNEED